MMTDDENLLLTKACCRGKDRGRRRGREKKNGYLTKHKSRERERERESENATDEKRELLCAIMTDHIPQVLPNSIPIPSFIVSTFSFAWFYFNHIMSLVPGGRYVMNYIRKSHQDDPYRTIVEILLILYGIVYYVSKPKSKKSSQSNNDNKLSNLSKTEIDLLIDEWQPEPLVDPSVTDQQKWRLTKIPEIQNGGIQKYITITRNFGKEHYSNVFNLASHNFLQLSSRDDVLQEAKRIIKNYGVGTCGPAGFYGNQDLHYTVEYDLARFFGTEGAVLYGQDFCVASSVLPAFTKRGDIIVADDRVSLNLQNALQLSRSTVYYFEHNNMDHLESVLHDITEQEKLEKLAVIPRKFILTEGIFYNSGDVAPLPQLVKLKNKYKFRLFVDETFSLGVLGATGRGLSEHFQMERDSSIDITVGSMATAFGSSGGFVLGDNVMSYHQHIGSNAYCFSASLPSYATRVVSKEIEIMEKDNSAVKALHNVSQYLYNFFTQDKELAQCITVTSAEVCPITFLRLTDDVRQSKFQYTEEELFDKLQQLHKKCITTKFVPEYEREEQFLQSIVDELLQTYNILITRNTLVLQQETLPVVPSLKICANALMTEDELQNACHRIKDVILKHCTNI